MMFLNLQSIRTGHAAANWDVGPQAMSFSSLRGQAGYLLATQAAERICGELVGEADSSEDDDAVLVCTRVGMVHFGC
jgi:hypothetical protein